MGGEQRCAARLGAKLKSVGGCGPGRRDLKELFGLELQARPKPCSLETPMQEIPGDLKFLKSHEWARIEDDGTIRVGISDHAQSLLGDLVYVELPHVGDDVESGKACAVVESVKAASDVYAPVSGTIVEVNSDLADTPEVINNDAYGDGWLFTIQPAAASDSEFADLLEPNDYADLIENEDH